MCFIKQHCNGEQHRLNVLLSSYDIDKEPLSVPEQILLFLVLEDLVLDAVHVPLDEELLVAQVEGEAYGVLHVRLVVVEARPKVQAEHLAALHVVEDQ